MDNKTGSILSKYTPSSAAIASINKFGLGEITEETITKSFTLMRYCKEKNKDKTAIDKISPILKLDIEEHELLLLSEEEVGITEDGKIILNNENGEVVVQVVSDNWYKYIEMQNNLHKPNKYGIQSITVQMTQKHGENKIYLYDVSARYLIRYPNSNLLYRSVELKENGRYKRTLNGLNMKKVRYSLNDQQFDTYRINSLRIQRALDSVGRLLPINLYRLIKGEEKNKGISKV